MSVFLTTKKILRRHWLTFTFFLGFLTDVLLLNRVDDVLDNLILLFYVLFATASLFGFYLGITDKLPFKLSSKFERYMPLLMQYSFGGLFSGMLIFYGRSGDLFASAPFLLLIVAVILGNELFSKRSDRLVYYLVSYFVGIFSYLVMVIPVLTGKMGLWSFAAAGFVALGVMIVVTQLLFKIIPNFMAHNIGRIIFSIGVVYVGFNVLYLTNIIPPIPLSLTELSVVQSVERTESGVYRVRYEDQLWFDNMAFWRPIIHPNGSVSCFSRVYTPTKLSTKVYHKWEYKNPSTGEWTERFRLGYEISGLNRNGYGGYTTITNYTSGLWRCGVETERGQVLGREVFVIDATGKRNNVVTQLR